MLMDCRGCYKSIPAVEALAAAGFSAGSRFLGRPCVGFQGIPDRHGKRWSIGHVALNKRRNLALLVVANGESSKCNYRTLNMPLDLESPAGKFLNGVLKNQHHIFHVAAAEQLEELADERDGAIARLEHSLDSEESFLHRRIAEIKEQECQIAVEEVMYMLIVYKFSNINVPMVERLSQCIINGRLEAWPTKDKELKSIHSVEVLELVREHMFNVLSWRRRFGTLDNWKTTQIDRIQLGRVYAASIMYGYFLKSACLRHHLDLNLALTAQDYPLLLASKISSPLPELNLVSSGCHVGMKSPLQHRSRSSRSSKLKDYVMGFDPKTFQRCAKLRSQEVVNLIEKHSLALFENTDDEVIDVTVPSLKRLVLEAVAFGSFLWDVEGYIDSVYRLKET
ncbi:hypothetical protein QJS04_geneDACA023250 [Acorus gramineus]|uniref:Uncharacterized protein n=1 Tax=Acorus gramineus TaxID=55184 RepID=A0AAV9A6B1_ACOGR|nr:hypothetical protein QJS04_geneDACA023250 [Acorus gramineus]